jgi:dTDP-4-dehydrorhamnose 3,5-epimerase
MSGIKILNSGFKGLYILEPALFGDDRGYFMESYNYRDLQAHGINVNFVQDNQSKSRRGVLRGLHFQDAPYAQTKLIRVLQGIILDTTLDLRKDQKTFGKSFSIKLSAESRQQLLIPKGFAHGFIVLSDSAEVLYKTDEYHYPEAERGILYNDPALGLDWVIPDDEIILSERDRNHPVFKDTQFGF